MGIHLPDRLARVRVDYFLHGIYRRRKSFYKCAILFNALGRGLEQFKELKSSIEWFK